MFGLAPGADWPFHQIPRRPHHQVNHRIIQGLCRFCSSAKTLALPACAGSRFRVREDFPQRPRVTVNRPPTPSRKSMYLLMVINFILYRPTSDFPDCETFEKVCFQGNCDVDSHSWTIDPFKNNCVLSVVETDAGTSIDRSKRYFSPASIKGI